MKKLTTLLFLGLITIIAFSCSNDDASVTPVPPITNNTLNTGDLKLFVIDTAKVKTITMTGTNEITILNRKVNSNSYIGGFSVNADASKFVYVDNQGAFTNGAFVGAKTIRVANANGSGDVNIYTAPSNTSTVSNDIGFVKFGMSKIYFLTTKQTISGGFVNTVSSLNASNFDGSNLVTLSGSSFGSDITSDGRFLIQKGTSTPPNSATGITILDRNGDNGAGSLYNLETLPASVINSSQPIFSYDDKFAYYAFVENQMLKVKIFNMTTKIWESKTIATNFTSTTFAMSMSVGSDNNRGVVTVQTSNNMPSKSYIFNLSSGSSTNFNNNDENVFQLNAF